MPWKPPPLPPEFKLIARSEGGGSWELKTADAITLRTPSGDIDLYVADNQPTVRSFAMQGRAGIGGPDNTVVILFGQPSVSSPREEPPDEPPEDDRSDSNDIYLSGPSRDDP